MQDVKHFIVCILLPHVIASMSKSRKCVLKTLPSPFLPSWSASFYALWETGYNVPMSNQTHRPGTVLEAQRTKLAPPPLYTVLLLNDDFTPMDFVVHVLQKFFSMDRERATQIMLKVHVEGRGICGVYPRDIAATKVEQVSVYARANEHPLACVMEEN